MVSNTRDPTVHVPSSVLSIPHPSSSTIPSAFPAPPSGHPRQHSTTILTCPSYPPPQAWPLSLEGPSPSPSSPPLLRACGTCPQGRRGHGGTSEADNLTWETRWWRGTCDQAKVSPLPQAQRAPSSVTSDSDLRCHRTDEHPAPQVDDTILALSSSSTSTLGHSCRHISAGFTST